MSGSSIPYRLRPNKFIDRELFVDLIKHLVPQRDPSKYIYISMGGKHLVDHSIVYKKTGIPNLFSLDFDEKVVLRQKFNRPTDTVICEELPTNQLATSIDRIYSCFPEAANLIIWLDYTRPKERFTQLQEVVDVAKRLAPGDMLRITFNTHPGTLDQNGSNSDWKEAGAEGPGQYRAIKLREQIGDFLPASMTTIGHDEFPEAMAAAVEIALSKASQQSGKNLDFTPVLLTTYQDGQRMTTATVVVTDDEHPFVTDRATWQFLPTSWKDVLSIAAPDLSVREKMKLDLELSKSTADIAALLDFPFTEEDSELVINSYKLFHRYYPSFQHTDL